MGEDDVAVEERSDGASVEWAQGCGRGSIPLWRSRW